MLTANRRDVLIASAVATASVSTGVAFAKDDAADNLLTVYTPGYSHALELARNSQQTLESIIPLEGDVVRLFKTRVTGRGRVLHGYTSWSDYVLLRGLAEELGLRVRAEAHYRGASGRTVFRWVMS